MVIVNIAEKEAWRRGLISAGVHPMVFKVVFIISTKVEFRKDQPLYGLAVMSRARLAELTAFTEDEVKLCADVAMEHGWLKARRVHIDDVGYLWAFELTNGRNFMQLESLTEEHLKYDYANVVTWEEKV